MLLVALAWAGGASAQGGPGLSEADMIGFLVQCIGTDRAGQPRLPSPGSPGCRPQGIADRAGWRKHDWPDRRDPDGGGLGFQASDSVLDRHLGFPLVVQTFDFGDDGRRFRTLDRGRGDGGDAAAVLDGAAWIFFTEDGGNGQQWFVAEACGTDPRPQARIESWLLFGADAAAGEWRDRLARLTIARSVVECPSRFSNAYTRYRRDTITVPFRIVRRGKATATRSQPVDTIVSEHFGGRSIEAANHLERFYFGRGLGKYRWERWEDRSKSKEPDLDGRARLMAQSGRCMPLPYSASPGESWTMVDCRTWTNLVRQAEPWSVAQYGWPGTLLDALQTGR